MKSLRQLGQNQSQSERLQGDFKLKATKANSCGKLSWKMKQVTDCKVDKIKHAS